MGRKMGAWLSLALTGLGNVAHAQHGTLSFTGSVNRPTCVVQPLAVPIAGPNMTVMLPSIAHRSLSAAGRRGTPIPFHLIVGSGEHPCDQTSVRALFRDAGYTNAAGRLDNYGKASNVSIVVTNEQRQDVNLASNENSLIVLMDDNGIGVMSWFASYYATGAAEPGTVRSQVNYLLEYP